MCVFTNVVLVSSHKVGPADRQDALLVMMNVMDAPELDPVHAFRAEILKQMVNVWLHA